MEKAVVYASSMLSDSQKYPKPVLLHSIRVGTYLYERNYPLHVVIAGYLHDIIEDTQTSEAELAALFGSHVASLVTANSRNISITDSDTRREELIRRCLQHSQDAAIIKAADIIDNFMYYRMMNDQDGLKKCIANIQDFRKYRSHNFTNQIFDNLPS
jgi:guanosine-3',5'-bis(diphosphate) 3'-pyrophosphohydrolase